MSSPGPPAALSRAASHRAHWFPLAVFGVLIAVSLPLSIPGPPIGWYAYAPLSESPYPLGGPRSALSFGSPASGLTGIPEGWYWAAALAAGFLLTAAWYRRPDRRPAAPGRGYLLISLALTVLVATLPLLAWNIPMPTWLWLTQLWSEGSFALLVVAAGIWLLAWRARSRALWLTACGYTVAALAADWPPLQRTGSALTLRALSVFGWHPLFADGAVLLPALALLIPAALAFRMPVPAGRA